ncbi:transcriptional repressor TCF25-domain-containing protein [Rhodocollybia butyracea]|uniref:Transcriptional repressor TCF25-domain-containing protein n=1 Tax=Rhodocollybia butyracea TaxID=206335 RepID=A0A9P5TW31_9AGAR|nr:transcriptional repressor TCF25-domain-containing protein [Rhodocollybia butyracea]
MNTMTRSLSSFEAELKKFFGSKVVAANKDKSSGSSKRAHVTQRSVLTKPQSNWPPAHMREGLSAKQLTDEEVAEKFDRNRWTDSASGTSFEGERWWTVEYSKKYKSTTMLFLHVVASGDPQGFYGLIQRAPWHADSWLQLAEVFRHREEHSSAVDAVDRVMFAYERAFVGGFSFTTGLNRLDFDRVENRPFYLALHRQASDLQRRGCMRTAFEFTKLMYSLDPWCDPHGALLHLDFLAFKAGMPQWLLDVFKLSTSTCRMDPSVLPGWTFARALALRLTNKEQDKSSNVALPANIRGHKDFRIQTDSRSLSTPIAILHLLSHIYVQRSFSLWKDPKIADWFAETMTSHFSSLPSSLPPTPRRNRFITMYSEGERTGALPYAVYRHLLVLESTLSFRSLLPFIPNPVLSSNNSGLACDPLPPPNKVRLSEYGDEFFAGIDKDEELVGTRRLTRRERELQERRLARLIPNVHERHQVQAIFENNPALQQRFPGPDGILQFAQAMEMLPPDALEDLLAVAAMDLGENVDGRGMPGQMPGLEDILLEAGGEDEDLSGDEEEDEDEDISVGCPFINCSAVLILFSASSCAHYTELPRTVLGWCWWSCKCG